MFGPCPGWEYEKVPGHQGTLLPRVEQLLVDMYAVQFNTLSAIRDTRSAHKRMFAGLTPALNPKYAGNYRGSDADPCLKIYRVEVQMDHRVGSPPARVEADMSQLTSMLDAIVPALDTQFPTLAADEFANHLVELGCVLLELFFRIHPYANGNGHAGRYILTALFKRYGFRFTAAFPIEPKPADRSQYSICLSKYRNGDKDPLHTYLASCLDRAPGPAKIHGDLVTALGATPPPTP